MNALVLSGGSIKGCFQAGAVEAILKSGFVPDYIWGVSVGALNGAFLADRAGQAAIQGTTVDWPAIGKELTKFWSTNVTKPSDLVQRRKNTALAWAALRARFDGMVNTSRLQDLIRKTLKHEHILKSPAGYSAGVVDLAQGDYFNADARRPDLIEMVIASTSIPFVMPLKFMDGRPLADGGVRDVAPLRHAIAAGADRIVAVACYPEAIAGSSFNPRNAVQLLERVTDLLADEVLRNDLEIAKHINNMVPRSGEPAIEGPYVGKRRVDVTIIRPLEPLPIDILNFKASDIQGAIQSGRVIAEATLRHRA